MIGGKKHMGWTHDFDEATRHSFAYLTRLGYRACSEHSGDRMASVRYVGSASYEVTVDACPMRLEYDVTISHSAYGVVCLYELEQMVPMIVVPNHEHGIYEAHTNKDKLQRFVLILAERFRLVGMPLLTGEVTWTMVSEWRREQQQKKRVADLYEQLSEAFKVECWADVVYAARELGANARKLDLKRLAYAQKRLGEK